MLPATSVDQQDSSFLQNTANQANTTGAFGLLAKHNRLDKTQQLRAGRFWERMHLWATKEGLAMQPLNQATETCSKRSCFGENPSLWRRPAALVDDACLAGNPDLSNRILDTRRTAQPTPGGERRGKILVIGRANRVL